MKLLLIDDDKSLSRSMKMYFDTEKDIKTKQVYDGLEVLGLMKEDYTPDVIILDLNLPDRSGGELMDTIHNRWENARIYIHSAYVTNEKAFNGIVCGCFHKGTHSVSDMIKVIKPRNRIG